MREDGSSADRAAPLVIGLTGPIASGKSTVAEMLHQRGAEIIDADQVYHSLIRPHSPLLRSIVDRFGPTVLRENGELDRSALAAIVFNNSAALSDLDRLTHPAVVAEIRRRLTQVTAPYLVLEAVKLAQSGLNADVDSLWLILADQNTRVSRLMSRNGLDQEEARARVLAGGDPLPFGIRADVTIDTSDSLSSTRDAVDAAWSALLESHSRDRRFLANAEEAE